MLQSISYCSFADAGQMEASPDTAVLCVSEGRVPDFIFHWRTWLCLHLPPEEDGLGLWRKLGYQAVELLAPVYGELPHQILCFLEQLEQQTATHLLICCPTGCTRSAAVALYIADLFDLPFALKDGRYNNLLYETLKTHGPRTKKNWLKKISSRHPLLVAIVKDVAGSGSSNRLPSDERQGG